MPTHSSYAKIYVVRLNPGDDLKMSLREFAFNNGLTAAVVVTCVGSLVQYNLRFANQRHGKTAKGHFEIVSLVGTLSKSSAHLHLCIADEQGATVGGHLLDENLVYTTAEIAIGALPVLEFRRIPDDNTGYEELAIFNSNTP